MECDNSPPSFIFKLPYNVLRNISNVLDYDNKWRDLGGLMQYDITSLELFGKALLSMKSPTEKMLWDWSDRGHNVLELFILLARLKHYRAMLVLKPYVNSQYHHYLDEVLHPCQTEIQSLMSSFAASNFTDDLPIPNFEPGDQKESFPGHPNHMTPCENNESIHLEHSRTESKPPNSFIDSSTEKIYDESINKKHLDNPINMMEENSLKLSTFQEYCFSKNEPETYMCINKNDYNPQVKTDLNQRGESFIKLEHISGQEEKKVTIVTSHTTTIPYSEILQVTNNFDSASIIGKGGFGIVYKSKWRHTIVAIKRILLKTEDSQENVYRISLSEIQNLPLHRHDNILPLYGCSVDGLEPCLIYMYMSNGSLEDQLACKHNIEPLNWNLRHQIALGTARGIQFLHTSIPPLIHGDIKSANILLDKCFEPKLGDFGLARAGETGSSTHINTKIARGTTPYLPSEYLRNGHLSTKVDTYSFGVVLYEIATGLKAIINESKQYLREYVNEQDLNFYKLQDPKAGNDDYHLFPSFIKMGTLCSSILKKNRPDMTEVLQFFEQLDVMNDTNMSVNRNENPDFMLSTTQVLEDNTCKEFNEVQQKVERKTNNQVTNWSVNTHIVAGISQSAFSCIIPEDTDSQNIITNPHITAKYKSLPF